MEIGSGVEGWTAFERKGMFLTLFISNTAYPQPLDRFKPTVCQKLQVSVLMSTSEPNYEHHTPERPGNQQH